MLRLRPVEGSAALSYVKKRRVSNMLKLVGK